MPEDVAVTERDQGARGLKVDEPVSVSVDVAVVDGDAVPDADGARDHGARGLTVEEPVAVSVDVVVVEGDAVPDDVAARDHGARGLAEADPVDVSVDVVVAEGDAEPEADAARDNGALALFDGDVVCVAVVDADAVLVTVLVSDGEGEGEGEPDSDVDGVGLSVELIIPLKSIGPICKPRPIGGSGECSSEAGGKLASQTSSTSSARTLKVCQREARERGHIGSGASRDDYDKHQPPLTTSARCL